MATGPSVSVIMSVYNGAPFLYACVQSILQQHFRDFEFLILNDGSTDGSSEILRDLAKTDDRIRLIERENRGLVASLNELVAAARAPLLARMDADDISMPDRLSRQVAYLSEHPEVGVLGCNTHDIDERGFILKTTEQYPLTPAAARASLEKGPPVCHPSVVMRASLLATFYRPAFRHAEDYDLWLRVSMHTDICNLPERLLLYRRSSTQISQKHAGEQAKAAAIAWLDHVRRNEGKDSLFDQNQRLPQLNEIEAIFGDQKAAAFVQRKVVERLRYSNEMLNGPEFKLMVQQVRAGQGFDGALRTILRLGRKGRLVRAFILASAVAGLVISTS